MRHSARLRRAVVGLPLVGLASVAHAQATWHAEAAAIPWGNGNRAGPYVSLQRAIDRPTNLGGQRLLVAPHLDVGSVKDNLKTEVVRGTQRALVTNSWTLNAPSATVYCANSPTVEGFPLSGNASSPGNGSALHLEASAAVRCNVRDDSGLSMCPHVATLKDCTIVGHGPCVGHGPRTGSCAFALGTCLASGAHPGLVAGSQAHCPWWNREPLDPAGLGNGLSNGPFFGVAP